MNALYIFVFLGILTWIMRKIVLLFDTKSTPDIWLERWVAERDMRETCNKNKKGV